MTLRLLFVVLWACAPCVRAEAARPWPDARSRIVVFADQLPSNLSPAQWRFVTSHYAGSQKQTVAWTRRARAINPHYLMLHYQLAVGAGPAAFVEGDQWVNDFDRIARRTDWFVRDAAGQRILQKDWNWYVMDIRFDGDTPRTGFPADWTRTAIRRMRMNEADGCFADSYTQDILMNQVRPTHPLFSDVARNKQEWLPSLNRYGAYCTRAFHAQPERFLFLPNLGGQVTTWDNVTDLLVGDGGMIEGFGASAPGSYYSVADWKREMDRALLLARNDKILIAQSYIHVDNADHRWFIIGAHLLSKGPRSYLNMIHKGSLEWYPEYGLGLGAYRSAPPASVEALWTPEWRVYRRDFERGIVLVNPSDSPVTVSELGQTYRVVAATGGGAVGEDGATPGALSFTPARSVVIPEHSARVLLNPEKEPAKP